MYLLHIYTLARIEESQSEMQYSFQSETQYSYFKLSRR